MNDDTQRPGTPPMDDLQLLRGLRQLPTQRALPPDGWERLAARLDDVPREAPADAPATRRERRWLGGAAAAAAVAGALLLPQLLSVQSPTPVAAVPAVAAARQATTLQAQADALAGDYRQALDSFAAAPVASDYVPALQELDDSARQIRAALMESPRSTYLLQQLQRTYAQRLQLTREATLSAARLTS